MMNTRERVACATVMALSMAAVSSLTAQAPAAKRPSSKHAKPNAAVLYRQAIAEMKKVITDPKTGKSIIPDGYYEGGTAFLTEQWAAVIEKLAVTLTLFAQGTQTPMCKFNDRPERSVFELGLEVGSEDYNELLLIQGAQGWQMVDSDPTGACTIAFRMLDFSNHCAQNLTSRGAFTHTDIDTRAANLLQAGIAKLNGSDHVSIATAFLTKLEQQLKLRMSPRDIAASAEEGVRQLVFHDLGAKKNPAFDQASKRAMELTRELLKPMRDKPGITSAEFEAYGKMKIQAIDTLVKDSNFKEVRRTGAGDVFAASMICFYVMEFPFLLVGSAERIKQLEECRDELRKLAGKK